MLDALAGRLSRRRALEAIAAPLTPDDGNAAPEATPAT